MWSLIIVICAMGSFCHAGVGITHVDSFISHKMCEMAGQKVLATMKSTNVQYACVLEID